LGNAFHQLDRLEEAIVHYQKCLTIAPNSAIVLNNLGNAWQRQEKLEEAIACYKESLSLEPNNALAYNNLGTVFSAQGQLEEALASFQQGLILEPNNVESHTNLGLFYQDQRQYEKAISYFNRAIEIDPDYVKAHWNFSLILLKLGNFQQGFEEYEWRWRREQFPPRHLPKPVWDGSNLEGKTILLQAEQGMGDIIQFIRYVPLVVERGGHIIVECHSPIVRLLTTVAGVEKVVAIGETLPEFDVYIPLLSLPRILGTTLETIPIKIPYIYPLESVKFKLEIPGKFDLKVGIVWAGNPKHEDDQNRSCSLTHFLSFLTIPNIAFYSLQKEPKSAEIKEIAPLANLVDLSSKINNFADTAAVINQLDLVITVDTSVAHLAGALGKPVWVLLCYNPDWRWMTEREDSPWYPTVRVFRQNRQGDWQELIEILLIHVLEHLGQDSTTYLNIIKEMYRICQPGAKIRIVVPHHRHDFFFDDPTHVRVVTPMGLSLFSQRLNQKWIEEQAANSPLGLYLGVNFELIETIYKPSSSWFDLHPEPEVDIELLLSESTYYNNLIEQIEMVLEVVK
jgi:Tfp pilus assembly protein PilF